MVKCYVKQQSWIDAAELKLLKSIACGKKTFEQAAQDAMNFSYGGNELRALLRDSNAARGVTQRLKQVTGIGKDSLDYFPIRFKSPDATEDLKVKMHPFSLLSRCVERILAGDEFVRNHQTPLHLHSQTRVLIADILSCKSAALLVRQWWECLTIRMALRLGALRTKIHCTLSI